MTDPCDYRLTGFGPLPSERIAVEHDIPPALRLRLGEIIGEDMGDGLGDYPLTIAEAETLGTYMGIKLQPGCDWYICCYGP